MSYRTNSDNIYAEGTLVTAKANPALKPKVQRLAGLKITKYYQRMYYCAVVGNENSKQLVYFERELVKPSI
jgi:hypothetical protein